MSKVTPSIRIVPDVRRGTWVGAQRLPCITSPGVGPMSGGQGPKTASRSLDGESSISNNTVKAERISAFR